MSPIRFGAELVESIRHPDGNATGLTNFGLELAAKRLEFLKEIISKQKSTAGLALARKLPCRGYVKQVPEAGLLISYGADQHLIARRTAYCVDRNPQGRKGGRHAGGRTADQF
jgi:ABC-type uncharacterized transport system substrate-binding protein